MYFLQSAFVLCVILMDFQCGGATFEEPCDDNLSLGVEPQFAHEDFVESVAAGSNLRSLTVYRGRHDQSPRTQVYTVDFNTGQKILQSTSYVWQNCGPRPSDLWKQFFTNQFGSEENVYDGYGRYDVDNLYSKVSQKTLDDRYYGGTLGIGATNTSYYQRGHLVPCNDFGDATDRTATFYFFNAVPMWARINNGNWKSLEYYARKYAGKGATIRSGVYGTISRYVNGNNTSIYLNPSRSEIPIPLYLWKKVKNFMFIVLNDHTAKVFPADWVDKFRQAVGGCTNFSVNCPPEYTVSPVPEAGIVKCCT